MRLSKVKLSGFKSFVDQTTFVLTGKLNGIVGPNGCGKSNIIDAVRWVMGESSAKQLRGESMSDVIFNGSERRKPSGLASIELIFENEDGRLGGKWAEYREISVRRTLDRDGKSQYFLNGTRCRRRDITDIFLGTGLGPRSYAIIEQGMISRIVESKPEELRTFFEEAANISKYKERRHETEQRIEHTRTNLERLTDIRHELGKQLSKLDRQAATARRYQKLREEERALGYAQLYKQKEVAESEIQHLIDSHESEHENLQLIVANLNNVTTQLFDHKKSFESLEVQMNEKNSALYPYKQAVDHLDHELIRIRELEKRDLESQSEWQENGTRLEKEVEETTIMVDSLQQQIDENFYIVEAEAESIWQSEENLKSLQESLEKAQYDFRKQQDQIKSLQQKLELDRHSLQFQAEKRQSIEAERLRLGSTELPEDHSQSEESILLEESLLTKQMSVDELALAIDSKQRELQSAKEVYQALQVEQRKLSAQRNQLAGEVGMLEKMTVNEDKKAKSPLFEHLKVIDGWNGAVDSVLRQKLMVETDRKRGESYYLGEELFEFTQNHLGYYVQSDRKLGSILSHIYCFDDSDLDPFKIETDETFSEMRQQLKLHEFIVTKSGLLFGIDWAIYNREDANFGVLARQQSLERAIADLEEIDGRLEFLDESLYEQDETLKSLQNAIEIDQKELQKQSREQFELEKQLSLVMQQQTQAAKERHRIDSRLAELAKEESLNQELLEELQQKISDNDIALSLLEESWEAVSHRYESLKIEYDNAKQQSEKRRSVHLEKKQQLDLLNHELLRFKERKERAESELNILKKRMEGQQKNHDYAAKITEIEENRIIAIDNLEQFEATLTSLRIEHQAAKEQIQILENQKIALEESLNDQKTKLNQFSIKEAELNAKREMLLEKWDSLLAEISDEEIALAKEHHIEKAVEDLELSLQEKREAIAKIGAVNLVAITESEELRERKEYLDTQNSDLEAALAMLEKAINEIDDETRSRFMETFNAVNADFSRLFPRLFGGGRAYLELTEEDALTSGVNIIAHPPGKKPGTIHLLSGGEKALTAMALVFGIFNLNPAPFCMLDEVDAPLDEANVRRLGELIDEMSEKVQFIFITHNKATMTISDSLIGVTMAEPGVSRLVSVSLKDAIAFSDE